MTIAFSPQAEEKFQKLLTRYPNTQAPLIMALHLAQDEFGHVGKEVQAYVAKRLNLPPAFVQGVVSFYTMFREEPVGKYHVEICTNLTCELRGSGGLVAHCERKLGIKLGETTADKKFTVQEVECLAACGNAPAIQINGEYHEDLTPAKLDQLLNELK
jgi:NADH-quinone oxidoreductase subunit E